MKNTKATVFSLPSFVTVLLFWPWPLSKAKTNTTQVKVGVILDLEGAFGNMCLVSMQLALSDFYATHPGHKTRIDLKIRDSNRDVVDAASSALDLIKNEEVVAIIGPENSWQASFPIHLGNLSQVPIITSTTTSPCLTSIRSPYFIRATITDAHQVPPIVSIIKYFGWREVVPIYVDDTFGQGFIPYLIDGLQEKNIHVPYQSQISPSLSQDQISLKLYELMTNSTRVFIVHALPDMGYKILERASEIGMMEKGYVWIITDAMTHLMKSTDKVVNKALQGILGVKTHVKPSGQLNDFKGRWRSEFQRKYPTLKDEEVNIYGLWAYDAIIALAMAIEKVGGEDVVFHKTILNKGTDLDALGVSQYGSKLLQTLSTIKFKGLAGIFTLLHGELESRTQRIVNFNGGSEKTICFWDPKQGLMKKPGMNSIVEPLSMNHVLPITWPGESISIPRGWQSPISGKKLRVGVPIARGYKGFVDVTWDEKNSSRVTGFCISLFEEVLKYLPYAIIPEYIPYATHDRKPAGSYDDLIHQVHKGVFDAAVGDITIIANRSEFVDFTLPFTESKVAMLVPLQDRRSKSPWKFLKPWTWELWVTTISFFIFIGFVVWILEHRINDDFRGPPHRQIATTFLFSFSTMVFANKGKVLSNLTRFVVIVWFFVVLILTQNYTASLTSFLTIQHLQPTITNVDDLLKSKQNIGYKEGSFIRKIVKNLGFDDSNIKVYHSSENLDELLRKGTKGGGIAAAFDETPYIYPILRQYCSRYTIAEPTFKTSGFGFVFPRGSSLVSDVSKVVLKVMEDEYMQRLQSIWLITENQMCTNLTDGVPSNKLHLRDFWGLFLILGIFCLLSLGLFISTFKFKHRDLSSHTQRSRSEEKDNSLAPSPLKSREGERSQSPTIFAYEDNNYSTFWGKR